MWESSLAASAVMQFALCLWQLKPSPQNRRLKPVTLSKYQSWKNAADRLGHRICITVTLRTEKTQAVSLLLAAATLRRFQFVPSSGNRVNHLQKCLSFGEVSVMGFFKCLLCVCECGGGREGCRVFVTVCHFIYSEWRMRSSCQRHYMLYKGSSIGGNWNGI